jgi:hypothetical protein
MINRVMIKLQTFEDVVIMFCCSLKCQFQYQFHAMIMNLVMATVAIELY